MQWWEQKLNFFHLRILAKDNFVAAHDAGNKYENISE